MFPVNRNEMYLASAAGEFEGDLPEPVTRKEIFLNGIASRMGTFNRNLDALATMTPIESWADVQKAVRAGIAGKIFSIGDQLTCQRGNDTLVWDIIGIDHDTPADPQFTHSLTLQLHESFSTTMQFDAPEALYYAENGLETGTYHFTIDGTDYQFTLASDVASGGQLILSFTGSTPTSLSVSATVGGAISGEPVAVTAGSGGTALSASGLNHIDRVRFGSNRYMESAVRQWLASSEAAGSVWAPQTNFDRPPSWATTMAGFLNGMDADFLAVIGNVSKITAKNTVADGGGYDTTTEKFFLLSRSEAYGGMEAGIAEGSPYPYYSDYSELSAAGLGADSNRVKHRGSISINWGVRTPVTGHASDVRNIDNTGKFGSSYAKYAREISPACNII